MTFTNNRKYIVYTAEKINIVFVGDIICRCNIMMMFACEMRVETDKNIETVKVDNITITFHQVFHRHFINLFTNDRKYPYPSNDVTVSSAAAVSSFFAPVNDIFF